MIMNRYVQVASIPYLKSFQSYLASATEHGAEDYDFANGTEEVRCSVVSNFLLSTWVGGVDAHGAPAYE